MRVKHLLIDLWSKHSTGVTCVTTIVLLTLSTAIGMVSGLVHIAYTLHKHYILYKNNNMAKKEKDTNSTGKSAVNTDNNINEGYVQPKVTYVHPFEVKKAETPSNEEK